ncbi:MAG: restriction endonuclease subunit S [bacterium]|nr:restriction endonuclease subunit S [bacterium]
MRNWEVKNLMELANVSTGKWDANHASEEGKFRFYTCAYDYLLCDTNRFSGECLILPGNGVNVGEVFYYDGEFDAYQRTYVLSGIKLFPKYLHYHMLLYWKELGTKLQYGSATNFIKIGNFKDYVVQFPPLPEQQRIVAILDQAFAAIAKAKANAQQNLQNAKELFESYLQGVFENGNWEKKKWGELCEFVRGPFGGSLKKNIFKEDGYVVYEQKHAIHDHFNQLRYFIDEEKFNEMKRFELFAGDIIMSCSGVTLGRVAIVPEGLKRGIINQALLKLTPKKNISVHFIKHWLRSSIFQKIIFDYAGGAAIPNVPAAKILKDILIPCPSLKEQERIVNEIEIVLDETKRLEIIYQQKINDLEELKKSILQKAFSGELKMSNMQVVNF